MFYKFILLIGTYKGVKFYNIGSDGAFNHEIGHAIEYLNKTASDYYGTLALNTSDPNLKKIYTEISERYNIINNEWIYNVVRGYDLRLNYYADFNILNTIDDLKQMAAQREAELGLPASTPPTNTGSSKGSYADISFTASRSGFGVNFGIRF